MLVKLAVLIGLMLIMPSVFANNFYIEEESLSPIPESAETAIQHLETEQESWLKKCKFQGKIIDLTGNGEGDYLAVTTKDACGWGAALGPIWLLKNKGNSYSVLMSTGGYNLLLGPEKQNGLLEVKISAAAANWQQESTWQYDGKNYKKISEFKK